MLYAFTECLLFDDSDPRFVVFDCMYNVDVYKLSMLIL